MLDMTRYQRDKRLDRLLGYQLKLLENKNDLLASYRLEQVSKGKVAHFCCFVFRLDKYGVDQGFDVV
jgi:hypothetical protein